MRTLDNSRQEFTVLTGARVNGTEYAFSASVDATNHTVTITGLFGITVDGTEVGIPRMQHPDGPSDDTPFLLWYLSTLRICTGVVATEGERAALKSSEDPLRVVIDMDGSPCVVSCKCRLFVAPGAGACEACRNASTSLHRRKVQYAESKKVKNSILSQKQLSSNIAARAKEKKNVDDRERYWRKKFDRESILLDDEDHNDLSELMADVLPGKCGKNLKLLLSIQEQALQSRSAAGHRWHPQYVCYLFFFRLARPRAMWTLLQNRSTM